MVDGHIGGDEEEGGRGVELREIITRRCPTAREEVDHKEEEQEGKGEGLIIQQRQSVNPMTVTHQRRVRSV
jgi:hypothetical protein